MDPVAAFVGGGLFVALLGFLNDYFRDRRTDRRESAARDAQREVERNAFQRQTLLELQETLDTLTTTYVEAWVYLVNTSEGKPDLGSGVLSPDLQGRLDTTRYRVRMLSDRVINERLRDLVTEGLRGEVAFLYGSSVGEAHGALVKRNELLGNAMLRCGELARELY